MFKYDGKGWVQILNVGRGIIYLNNSRTFVKLGGETLALPKKTLTRLIIENRPITFLHFFLFSFPIILTHKNIPCKVQSTNFFRNYTDDRYTANMWLYLKIPNSSQKLIFKAGPDSIF